MSVTSLLWVHVRENSEWDHGANPETCYLRVPDESWLHEWWKRITRVAHLFIYYGFQISRMWLPLFTDCTENQGVTVCVLHCFHKHRRSVSSLRRLDNESDSNYCLVILIITLVFGLQKLYPNHTFRDCAPVNMWTDGSSLESSWRKAGIENQERKQFSFFSYISFFSKKKGLCFKMPSIFKVYFGEPCEMLSRFPREHMVN